MSNPYGTFPSVPHSSPTGPTSTDNHVIPPAIALIIVSVIGLIGMTGYFALALLGLATGSASLPAAGGEAERVGQAIGYYGSIITIGLNALLQPLILAAGICMLKRRNYTVCLLGTITAGIPCLGSSCCVLGMPFAIWAFVVLMREDVKATFR